MRASSRYKRLITYVSRGFQINIVCPTYVRVPTSCVAFDVIWSLIDNDTYEIGQRKGDYNLSSLR